MGSILYITFMKKKMVIISCISLWHLQSFFSFFLSFFLSVVVVIYFKQGRALFWGGAGKSIMGDGNHGNILF